MNQNIDIPHKKAKHTKKTIRSQTTDPNQATTWFKRLRKIQPGIPVAGIQMRHCYKQVIQNFKIQKTALVVHMDQ